MGMWSYVTKAYDPHPCDNCDTVEVEGQWWSLRNYYGISGYFCPKCFNLVSHDPHKQPHDPKGYNAVLVRQQLEKHR